MKKDRGSVARQEEAESHTPTPRGLEFLIFFTGAATLSLEVLASRIMTPYFGVSLYIWAGILAITLIFLALGYYLGGRLTIGRRPQSLLTLYLLAPLIAALFLLGAALIYPLIFPLLAYGNLIVASFVGGAMLLAFPLILLSAMNPLLIALDRSHRPEGDSGAGRVFFISTIGSVAGVILTAFLIIPKVTNFRGVLGISLGLCLAAGWTTWRAKGLPRPDRNRMMLLCFLLALVGLLAQWGHRGYVRLLAVGSGFDQWEVLAEYPSVFGNLKVVAVSGGEPNVVTDLMYVQDGIVQNHFDGNGQAVDHTPMMLRLADIFAPEAKQAGVLGLAAGAIPRQLKATGVQVMVAEINPRALQAATNFFGYDPQGIEHHWEDARTLVRRRPRAFDLVMVDLFQGDATPEYLLTREFFADLSNSLRPGGTVIMNMFFDPVDDYPNQRLLATITAVFPQILELRAPSRTGKFLNAYVVAKLGALSPALAHQAANQLSPDADDDARDTLTSARLVSRESLAHLAPVTDEHNIFPYLLARSHVRTRSVLSKLPLHLLIN